MSVTHHTRTVQCRDAEGKLCNVEVKVELQVDEAAIVSHIGRKALLNKSGRTKIVDGNVRIEVLRGIPKGYRLTERGSRLY